MTLDVNASGINSQLTLISAATGGADIDDDEDFRSRGLFAFQNPPQGGSEADYKQSLDLSGITRVWIKRRMVGAGTVGVYIMCDNNGFPVGADGISQLGNWGGGKATGDQLFVADYIYPLQTDTAIVYVCSPVQKIINFVIAGISGIGSTAVAAIEQLSLICFLMMPTLMVRERLIRPSVKLAAPWAIYSTHLP